VLQQRVQQLRHLAAQAFAVARARRSLRVPRDTPRAAGSNSKAIVLCFMALLQHHDDDVVRLAHVEELMRRVLRHVERGARLDSPDCF
jgi:hypothetical protein